MNNMKYKVGQRVIIKGRPDRNLTCNRYKGVVTEIVKIAPSYYGDRRLIICIKGRYLHLLEDEIEPCIGQLLLPFMYE